jgi:hypothetical protein
MINVLYAEADGVYSNINEIEVWDILKDARKCKNGHKAICHPPCERWGRYWGGGPSVKVKRIMGDDGQCFAHSLWHVRNFGGVIEHPEASHAWNYYGLAKPPKKGGWIIADIYGGFTCCVEQGNYGHKARKATWLYINKINAIELFWGKSEGKARIDSGFHSKEVAMTARSCPNYKPVKRISSRERIDTPVEFRDLLISMVLNKGDRK